jgi:putative peptidoglycan lipid II flippase
MIFWSIPATVLIIVLRAQLVRIILGSGAFNWDATRLTAAALALFILSLCAQSVSLLIARAYYAAGRTKMPLFFGIISVFISVISAFVLISAFHSNADYRYFVESLLRVSDIAGTTVLMLAFAYTLGCLVQALVGMFYFARDFSISYSRFKRLALQSFAASVIGGSAAYAALSVVGSVVDINTVVGIVTQGAVGGFSGLIITVLMLWLLRNEELAVAIAALRRRFKDSPKVALEPTDVSS